MLQRFHCFSVINVRGQHANEMELVGHRQRPRFVEDLSERHAACKHTPYRIQSQRSQRPELKSDAISKAEVLKELPKKQWVERTAAHRKTLDTLYQQYREALRQGAK